MRLFFYFVVFTATFILSIAPSCFAKQASTAQSQESGHVQFLFDGEPSVRFAPVGDEDAVAPCASKEEGGMRYNKKVGLVEFCDGTYWVNPRTPTCPAGQVAMASSDGKGQCISLACDKGQMLAKDASGNPQCVNIVGNMDCVVEEPYVRTGWLITHKCADNRRIISADCWRRNETSKPAGYDNWQNGLFTGNGNPDNITYSCVFENGNDPSKPNRWPGMGVKASVLCCR